MVYLKYNSVKLPVLDNYNIAKSSQEITFSDLKCDFTGHQKVDLPEKYQEVRVVEESKVNREIEKIEYEEKKDVKELSFESKVKEKISICKVHGYSSQETRSGKNKIIFDDIKETVNRGITYSIKNGVITLNGIASGVVNFYSNPINISAGKYTLSKNMGGTWSLGTATSSPAILLQQKKEDGSYTTVEGGELTAYSSAKNFTTLDLAEGTYRIRIFIATGNILNNFTWRPQLEEGENFTGLEQGGLMPSVEFPSEIKNVKENVRINIRNKNFCDLDILEKLKEKAITINSSNSFTINLENGRMGITSRINIMLPDGIDKSKKYRIKYHRKMNNTSFLPRLSALYADGSNDGVEDRILEADYEYVTSGKELSGITLAWNTQNQGGIVTFSDISITEINENSDFEESKKQTIIFPFKQGQKLMQGDYLADDGIHHKRKQVVLDGSDDEGWDYNGGSLSNNISAFTANISNLISVENTDAKVRVMCNKTIGLSASEATKLQKYNAIAVISDKRIYLCVQRSSFSTSPSTLKTWLQSNPITVEYELAEEVVEPYTVEQQKAWNNMQNLVSYVGINNINSSTNIDVKYPVRIKKEIVPETYDKLLYTGYIDDYVFDEMRELDIDTSINFTLMTPKKITTLRTCIAVGTYQLKDLIENIILAPLIDDGFILKTLEITDRKITVNYLCKTIEYCLNNLSNKFNFWWYIDENKNIYFKDIELLYSEDNIEHVYDDENKILGLEYIKPTVNSENYANVVNFTNVRIYEQSHMSFNGKDIVESYNPILEQQISTLKQNEQIDFLFPLDIKKENIIKSAESTSLYNNLLYGVYISGKYSDNTTFTVYYGYNKSIKSEIKTNNVGYEGNNADNEKEFLLIRDSFFNNLITGFRYNGTKVIKEIMEIKSDSALIWNIYKFYNDKGIEEKKDKISKTGIVETTINMNESWKTIQELEDIGASYIDKNSLKFDGQIELKADQNVFNVGERVRINKHMGDLLIDGTYIITEVQELFSNNEFEYIAICKNSNMLSNFIDTFRGEDTQESSEKTYKLYVTHYNEEQILESHEVVQ
jgi:hypothetical protein|nr:MAG TPA: hypothetical protein [Caudoviricetes sp.]